MLKLSATILPSNSTFSGAEAAHSTILLFLCLVSLVGMILMCMLMKSYKYRNRSYTKYFLLIAIFDFAALFLDSLFDIELGFVKMSGGTHTYIGTYEECAFVSPIVTTLWLCSSWLLVSVAIDRYIPVFLPHLRLDWCTKKRAKVVIVVVVIIMTALELIYLLINYRNVSAMFKNANKIGCVSKDSNTSMGFDIFVNVFLKFAIPMPLVIWLSVKTTLKLRNDSVIESEIGASNVDHIKPSSYSLTALVVLSAFTIMPEAIANFIEYVMMQHHANFHFLGSADSVYMVLDILYAVNYSCKFFVLVASGPMYRRDMLRLCADRRYRQIIEDDTYAENEGHTEQYYSL